MPRSRPSLPLAKIVPGVAQGTHAALLIDDLGAQIAEMTLVANSVSSLNIVLNSLRTSNVVWAAYPTRASQMVTYHEVTAPTTSAVFIGVQHLSGSNSLALGAQGNIVSRVIILQSTA